MTDYEKEYQRCANACGEAFDEFVAFFESALGELAVLDLGCGQGRDALMTARRGHRVHGVDLAPTGIAQLAASAAAEQLSIECEVADVEEFQADREYDLVIVDRVLHMLATDQRRIALLERVLPWIRPGGFALIADTRRHRKLIRHFFSRPGWQPVLDKRDFLIACRSAPPAG